VTRYQRARKSTEQSTARSGDHVIERGIVWFHVFGRDTIVLGDLAVNTEVHRIFLNRKISTPDLALHRLHLHLRDVLDSGHTLLLSTFSLARSIQAVVTL